MSDTSASDGPGVPRCVPRCITGPGVWMEGSAIAQLEGVAALSGCAQAVGMPDLHAGRGPVGAAFLFNDGIHPALIGGDAGCGVRAVGLSRLKATGDALERRVRAAMEEPVLPEVPEELLLRAAWTEGVRGLTGLAGVPEELAAWAAEAGGAGGAGAPERSAPVPEDPSFAASLGTIGGGNHFAEIGEIEGRGVDGAQAAILAHSGSRGLGAWLAARWGRLPADVVAGEDLQRYVAELDGACRFAEVNRLLLAWRLLEAVGGTRAERRCWSFDIAHNTVLPWGGGWLHRKGAAPAESMQRTVVLGSRGARSALMEGRGAADLLCSVAHGAGRKMTRQEAVAKLKPRYKRDSLHRTALGSRVICDDPQLLYEEHPDSYKAIEPVVEALESAGAASRLAWIRPLLTVKQ